MTLKFPRSQSDQASMRSAGQTSPITEGPTWLLTGPKEFAANVLNPNTTTHIEESCLNGSELFW